MTQRMASGRDLVGELAIALAHGLAGGDGCIFDYTQELQRKIGLEVVAWRIV